MAEQAVFVELDGGLILPAESADRVSLESLRLTEGCLPALARFRDAGYSVVILQNSVPAAAADGPDAAASLESFVTSLLTSQGIPVTAFECCAHARDEGCDCALPGIGLVTAYIAGERLNRAHSIVVGGGDDALGLARAIGIRGFAIDADSPWREIAHTVLDEPRRASVTRTTRETDIAVEVDLDRAEDPSIETGIGFFDHMLEQLGKHGGFALSIRCSGDLEVDEHHTVEDVALALGQALRQALGDKRGIGRYGFLLPMDEAEAQVALDLSGRAYAVFEGDFPRDSVGGLPTELVSHFFRSLAETLGAALHVSVRGENAHHMVEACFKSVARTLRQALAREGSDLPSTKGTL
ncbi:MAG: imidazoleglycerol-phosphate dehydratase HisB [Gammaproteobacteria bacterium]|jgi:imidazoleglycerol-phosphate dehydratase/histidinol-phosphatase